jgi:hypothetical protein
VTVLKAKTEKKALNHHKYNLVINVSTLPLRIQTHTHVDTYIYPCKTVGTGNMKIFTLIMKASSFFQLTFCFIICSLEIQTQSNTTRASDGSVFNYCYNDIHKGDLFLPVCIYRPRLRGLVVRVSGYRSRGPGFPDFLERGPLILVRTIEELLEWKSSGSGLENRDYLPWEFVALTTQHPLPAKLALTSPTSGGRSVRYSSFAGYGHGI